MENQEVCQLSYSMLNNPENWESWSDRTHEIRVLSRLPKTWGHLSRISNRLHFLASVMFVDDLGKLEERAHHYGHVLPGTVIYTDSWKGYSNLKYLGFTHYTMNHNENFVDRPLVSTFS
ncbi:unnamed protein product [Heligmosomoides polygyrus]|uniref:DDE_Tnp_IS1595 domain-containing protein n=1 Tax=Heligmosomoides polygyrus TaxID=6339 RepID=A0A183F447_HELPZ|nr:unnamed protein product [Heligmosomoides polygyrus]